MNQNLSTNNSTPSWRDLRDQERQERRAARGESGWIFGIILVLLGVLLWLQNMNAVTISNWWALFILLPAFGALASAWRMYSRQQEVSAGVISSFFFGVVLLGVVVVFVFNLTLYWGIVLPVLLIFGGVSMLLPAILSRR